MPRFVILEHDHPFLHWDLMLEVGDRLRTWRLAQPPEQGKTIRTTLLADHRRLYLDYQGPLSGERGRVVRWDAGTFAWEREEGDAVEVILEGTRACGRARLARVQGDEWSFTLF